MFEKRLEQSQEAQIVAGEYRRKRLFAMSRPAINGANTVKDSTRERVLSAIDELNYRPRAGFKSIGLIVVPVLDEETEAGAGEGGAGAAEVDAVKRGIIGASTSWREDSNSFYA